MFCASAVLGEPTKVTETSVITNLAQLRALSRPEAGQVHPVRVQGVVTWQAAWNLAFVVDDGTQAVYVDVASSKNLKVWAGGDLPPAVSEPGAIVQVEGVASPGGYAPVILPANYRRVGSGTLAPRHLDIEQLLSGSADALLVEVEGVVQDVGEDQFHAAGIRLIVAGHNCRVSFANGQGLNATNLLDAKVRVRGVLASVFNLRSEAVGLKINANGVKDLDVLLPPPRDPFRLPKVTLNRLRLFSPDAAAAFHRKVTQGVVIFAVPHRFFFLQDGDTGVRVESPRADVQVGERVEVAGFVDTSRNIASLSGAVARSLGKVVVAPVSTTVEQILHPPQDPKEQNLVTEDLHCRLVKIRGKLLQFDRASGNQGFSELLIESETHVVRAALPVSSYSNAPSFVAWQEGAELELTGVSELDFKEDAPIQVTVAIVDFRLWLRSPQDVHVVRTPPWWTVRRLWMALSGTILAIFVAVAWSLTLQRLLRERTDRLEEVMRAHRDVELEYSSARRERLRLAADLHDGLKQLLAAASFRLEAVAAYLPDSPLAASEHLTSAHTTLIRTQAELQECMQGLHVLEEGPPELAELLRQVVASNDYWPKGAVVIENRGAPHDLPRDFAGSLLLLFQEAVTNALHHGHASRIQVLVEYTAACLNLRIVDNGIGFDPAAAAGIRSGHFGIDGMKKRVKWMRGYFAITRHEGGGMEVCVHIDWNSLPHPKPNAPSPMNETESKT